MNTSAIKSVRSPAYPNMSLEGAIEAVGKIEQMYRTSSVDRVEAARLIGYTTLSGPANKALAALASYGLVERAGKGEMRVTEGTQAILHPSDEEERNNYLVAAALNSGLFKGLQERFPNITPPMAGLESHLSRLGFNKNAIKPAAKAYLATLSYLEKAGAIISHGAELSGGPESSLEIDDEAQMVENSTENTPLQANPGRQASPMLERPTPSVKPGEVDWFRGSVGPETNVRVLAKGEMGPKEIGKLIKLLEAQKLVLEDD